jgi:Xaa-Pro aminopeptidase
LLSMEPAIKRGLTFWDRALMPRDEFDERIALVRAEMRRAGMQALVVAGNMYEDADLLWLTAGPVDGVLVFPLEGEAALFTNSGSREGFFLRELTFIEELGYKGALVGDAVHASLAARGIQGGRIGAAGFQVLASRPYQDLRRALSAYSVEDASPMLARLRAKLRPRERTAVQVALGMAVRAAQAADAAFEAGASNVAAAVEAERVARRAGAWDVRILANFTGHGLRPFEWASSERHIRLLLWIATRFHGYWADVAMSSAPEHGGAAARAIDAMVAAARPGLAVSEIATAGLTSLPEEARGDALQYGLGSGIGIELIGRPVIVPGCDTRLEAGALLSLRVFAPAPAPSFASRLIEIGEQGAHPLEPLTRAMAGWSIQPQAL